METSVYLQDSEGNVIQGTYYEIESSSETSPGVMKGMDC